jgi:UDP-2,3-diacylglucosamine pyrophosphatase LpxH
MDHLITNDTVVVISDLHVADPDVDPNVKKKGLDDFNGDAAFERLLGDVIPKRAGSAATLIINGDFIDFIQILPSLGRHSAGDRFGVTENESVLKLQRAFAGHPRVFDSLAKFLSDGGQVLVMPGNHDIDFHWPQVFEEFRKRLGNVPEPRLRFVKEGSIKEQRIYVEHGNQYSFDNRFDSWMNPILEAPDGRRRIERPWGTLFLDLIYNDIKDLYPFSNKVYPHGELAWIALRSFKNDKNVSAKAIAQLMVFFARKGKRFLWERMMGADENRPVAMESVWERVGSVDADRREEITAQISALIGETEGVISPSGPPAGQSVMLGRNDDWGMGKRRHELLTSGEFDIVVFGHTHTAVDGNKRPSFGTEDARRSFNTGSWVPSIPIGEFENPTWADLETKASLPDIHYLLIDLKPHPTASLETLTS